MIQIKTLKKTQNKTKPLTTKQILPARNYQVNTCDKSDKKSDFIVKQSPLETITQCVSPQKKIILSDNCCFVTYSQEGTVGLSVGVGRAQGHTGYS